MIPLTDEEQKYYDSQKKCYICEKWFVYDKEKDTYKNYKKVRDHCHFTGKFRGTAHSICNLRYNVPLDIPVFFHNGTKYDYHFISKELAEKFKGEDFKCLAENTEKYISFSVPIKKEIIDGDGDIKIITYNIKFIDSFTEPQNGSQK